MVGSDAVPAGVRITHLMRSGGAGAPPAGTRTCCEELADGVGAIPGQKRGPDAVRHRQGAPGGAAPWQQGAHITNVAPFGAPYPRF
jgi:hypothetical protein